MSFASVLVPLPFDKLFDYRIPDGIAVEEGSYVRVPFGSRELYGVVWHLPPPSGSTSETNLFGTNETFEKLKPLLAVAHHLPPMSQAMRKLIDWVAEYTLAPKGMVLKMAISVPDALHPPGTLTHYLLSDTPLTNTTARQRITSLLEDGFARTATDIAAETGVSVSTVRKLAEAGGLHPHDLAIEAALPHYQTDRPLHQLSSAQRLAADTMIESLHTGFSTSLLDGVTGSGKTEVYFDVMSHALSPTSSTRKSPKGDDSPHNQILILLPEIALSVQWLKRFEERFGAPPHFWHSSVPLAQKRETWRAIAQGKAQVIVGARSALFLPFANLRLIIVDEEHEHAYKQEDGVMYQARDMAVLRGKVEDCPVVLASATPSLETSLNVQQGKYAELLLPKRHGSAELPAVDIIDMRQHRPGAERWISEPLRTQIEHTLDAGNQAMLFINRRGYAPLVLCRSCGHRFACPHCTAWLVEHTHPPRLQCHHCDFRTPPPSHCPECGTTGEEGLVACGPGVERLAAEAARLFPDARIGQMTSDSLPSPESITRLIESVSQGEINLLIGTQMMAKGHHFPGLALVGVIDADMGLSGGDLRASERCWQLLHQLAGRAGRSDVKGHVYLQTYLPDHPVMQALKTHDRERFMQLEQQQREQAKMPPFGRLAALILEGPKEQQVHDFARLIARHAPQFHGVSIFGPAPAPLAMLRGKYRYRLLVKAPRETNLSVMLRNWLEPLKPPSSVRLKIDIDPYSFM